MKNALLLVLLFALCNAPGVAATKIISFDYPLFTNVFLRFLVAALFLQLYFKNLKIKHYPKQLKVWMHIIVGTIFVYIVPYLMLTISLEEVETNVTVLAIALMPIIVALLSYYLLPTENLTRFKFLGILLGFIGLLVLIIPEIITNVSYYNLLLDITIIIAPLSYGLGTVYFKKYTNVSNEVAANIAMFSSVLLLLPIVVIEQPWNIAPSQNTLWTILFNGVFCTALPCILFFKINESYGPVFLSLSAYLQPLIGALIGVILFKENLSSNFFCAGAFILLGVFFCSKTEPVPVESKFKVNH